MGRATASIPRRFPHDPWGRLSRRPQACNAIALAVSPQTEELGVAVTRPTPPAHRRRRLEAAVLAALLALTLAACTIEQAAPDSAATTQGTDAPAPTTTAAARTPAKPGEA